MSIRARAWVIGAIAVAGLLLWFFGRACPTSLEERVESILQEVRTSPAISRPSRWFLLNQESREDIYDDALDRLVAIGPPAVGPLCGALGDEDVGIRWLAEEALGGIGDGAAVEALVATARANESDDVRLSAVRVLAGMQTNRATWALVGILRDETGLAISIDIGAFESTSTIPISVPLQALVARELGRNGRTQAIPALIGRLDDEDRRVVAEACVALGKLGGDVAEQALLSVLNREPYTTGASASAAAGLAATGNTAHVDPLIVALRGGNRTAPLALAELGDPRGFGPVKDALLHADPRMRRAAARAVGRYGAPEMLPPLVKRLWEEPDEEVCHAIIVAMGEIGDPRSRAELKRAAQAHKFARVRAAARSMVGRMQVATPRSHPS